MRSGRLRRCSVRGFTTLNHQVERVARLFQQARAFPPDSHAMDIGTRLTQQLDRSNEVAVIGHYNKGIDLSAMHQFESVIHHQEVTTAVFAVVAELVNGTYAISQCRLFPTFGMGFRKVSVGPEYGFAKTSGKSNRLVDQLPGKIFCIKQDSGSGRSGLVIILVLLNQTEIPCFDTTELFSESNNRSS